MASVACRTEAIDPLPNVFPDLLTWYMFGVSNNLRYNDVYGFIDPQVIHETNDFDEITTYLTSRFASGRNIHFIPYISGLKARRRRSWRRRGPGGWKSCDGGGSAMTARVSV
ncbi:hypothetical protein LR48_Vigan04g061100 [Vigna angularis]|uniref:Uncharacterized protein n=1 Tax=Phaseolus angularis TaxID=3914 RepID=A0A0L9UCC5_PHAAN|nr:hypothetical protein LR48_Vigan04g061100 [Vigna angularis]